MGYVKFIPFSHRPVKLMRVNLGFVKIDEEFTAYPVFSVEKTRFEPGEALGQDR